MNTNSVLSRDVFYKKEEYVENLKKLTYYELKKEINKQYKIYGQHYRYELDAFIMESNNYGMDETDKDLQKIERCFAEIDKSNRVCNWIKIVLLPIIISSILSLVFTKLWA